MLKLIISAGNSSLNSSSLVHNIVFIILSVILFLVFAVIVVACIRYLRKGVKRKGEKDD